MKDQDKNIVPVSFVITGITISGYMTKAPQQQEEPEDEPEAPKTPQRTNGWDVEPAPQYTPRKRRKYARFTPEEDAALVAFYRNPENQTPSGKINRKKLSTLARFLHRSRNSVMSRAYNLKKQIRKMKRR